MGANEVKRPRPTDQSLEALKTLVTAFGSREAARQCGMNESTVCGIAWRHGWKKAIAHPNDPTRKSEVGSLNEASKEASHIASSQSLPMVASRSVSSLPKAKSLSNQSPSSALASALSSFRQRSMIGLARYSAQAAEAAAKHKKPLDISRKAKDISDVHKALYPADNQSQNILQIGVLIRPLPQNDS